MIQSSLRALGRVYTSAQPREASHNYSHPFVARRMQPKGLLTLCIDTRHGRLHIGASEVSWPPWKNGWKIKKRKHAKKSSFLCLCYILRAIRAGRCRERRYAYHIFIQIYFRMHQNAFLVVVNMCYIAYYLTNATTSTNWEVDRMTVHLLPMTIQETLYI